MYVCVYIHLLRLPVTPSDHPRSGVPVCIPRKMRTAGRGSAVQCSAVQCSAVQGGEGRGMAWRGRVVARGGALQGGSVAGAEAGAGAGLERRGVRGGAGHGRGEGRQARRRTAERGCPEPVGGGGGRMSTAPSCGPEAGVFALCFRVSVMANTPHHQKVCENAARCARRSYSRMGRNGRREPRAETENVCAVAGMLALAHAPYAAHTTKHLL